MTFDLERNRLVRMHLPKVKFPAFCCGKILLKAGHMKSDLLKDRWFDLKRYYAINYNMYKMDAHRHLEYEIMYVVHGKCQVKIINENQSAQLIDIKEGQFIFINSMELHELIVNKCDVCRVLNLEIGISKANGMFNIESVFSNLSNSIKGTSPYWLGKDKTGQLCEIILSLQNEHLQFPDKNTVIKESWMLLLIETLCRIYKSSQERQNKGRTYFVRKASDYILNNYDNCDISVDNICSYVGVSKGYLHRLFLKETGFTLFRKITDLRIEKAKFLLSKSNLGMSDIAASTGFNSRQHFSSIFSSTVGCSPNEYRLQGENVSFFEGFPQE